MPPFVQFLTQNARWLGAGFVLAFASGFGQTFFISVFAGEIRADFGLSHAGWGGLYALATATSALVMIWAGGLTDRFRVRNLGVIVLLALAVVALAMAFGQGIAMLWVTVFGLRLFGQGMLSHISLVSMARWFVATRGRAVSIAGLGMALAEAALPIGFVALMGVFDWRVLWMAVAVVLGVIALGVWPLLRSERTPQAFAAEPGNTGMGGYMWTRVQALRNPVFWLMLPALMGPPVWNTAFYFHQVHLAEAKGWTHLELVAMFPLLTLCSISTMMGAGWLVDRIGSPRLSAVYLVPLVSGYALFAVTDSQAAALVAMAVMGMGVGLHGMMMSTFWAEVYGTLHLGKLRAMTGAVMVMGTAIGPGLTGALIDFGISFPQQTGAIAGYFVVASVLAGFAGRAARRGLAAEV